MNADPLDVALREVTETKHLLEALVTASETFDYFRAKATLEELRLKVKVLGRAQAEIRAQGTPAGSDRIVPFPFAPRLQN